MTSLETTADIITRLAELPCPTCVGCGRTVGCYTCDGSGVRFPWLRQECSDCKSSLTRRPTGRVNPDWLNSPPCNLCHGTGWVPHLDIPLDEALAMLPVYERSQILEHWRWPLWEAASITAEDVRLVFWQAVEKEEQERGGQCLT